MKILKRFLVTILTASLCLGCFAPMGLNAVSAGASSKVAVDMIVTNPAEDASTAMNVGFHAALGYTNCYVQYAPKSDPDWSNARNQSGNYVTYGADEDTNPFYNGYSKDYNGNNYYQTNTFLDYSVTLSDLTPATEYKYRVCDGARFSDTYYFKTAGADKWSFVVTGDFHVYYTSTRADKATTAVNAAIALADQQSLPAVEHIVSIGDIVAWGISYNQWQHLTNQPYFKNYSFANAIGNHDDMDRFGNSSSKYNAICFNNPKNGYGDEIGTCYYYLYNDVLFLYLNYLDPSAEAEAWAQSVVDKMAGQYKFSVLVNHRPATSKYNGGTYSYFWDYWADFCDLNKIDLVLAGDHHVYMRSHALKNGSVVSGYGASNPDGTVYIAADSSDGDRGSSTDVVSSWKSIVAEHYYRYEYSGSSADITSMLVSVDEDKMQVQFVYYESNSSASHPSFKEGTVTGHSNFYYGDTSYVYPSDHSTPAGGGSDDPGPAGDGVNLLAANLEGQYKYTSTVYPGSSAYYGTAYYGDNGDQGAGYISGKLNDGVYPSNSNPGSSNEDWATFFKSSGKPDITCKLYDEATINGLSINYRGYTGGSYSLAPVTEIFASTDGENFTPVTAYTTANEIVSGNNYNLNVSFTTPVTAKYIQVKFGDPNDSATRFAVGELEVLGTAGWATEEGGAGQCEVVFKSEAGVVITVVHVPKGGSATPPYANEREGLHFIGWDKDYNCVTEDMEIYEVYSDDECKVVFKDWDGAVLSTQTVAFGAAATPPANPTREEYVFTGWDLPYESIAGDKVITALYVHQSEIDNPDQGEPIVPVPYGDNILLHRPYELTYNQFLNATVSDDNFTLLTDGVYRGNGTMAWTSTVSVYGVTVEFAGSSAVNFASFTFDAPTDVGVVVFKNVRINGNRGFAPGAVSYTTNGTEYTEAEIEVTQLNAEGGTEGTHYEIRVKADIKDAVGLKISWTNNGEYVSNFEEIEAYSAYYAEGEEPSTDEPSTDEPSTDEPSTDEPSTDEPSIDEPSTDEPSTDEPADVTYGDVNGDGSIDSLDAAQDLKHDAMLITLDADALAAADVNGDGTVDSLDAAQILKYDAMLIDRFPVEG